jgi:hypothetical protein
MAGKLNVIVVALLCDFSHCWVFFAPIGRTLPHNAKDSIHFCGESRHEASPRVGTAADGGLRIIACAHANAFAVGFGGLMVGPCKGVVMRFSSLGRADDRPLGDV